MASETLRYDVVTGADTRGFKETAREAGAASRAARELSDKLATQSKTAQVAAGAAIALAKSDKILRDAELELSGAAEEARAAMGAQGKAAEESAVKTRLAGEAARGAGGGFGALATPMGAAIGAGVALAPVAVTLAAGLGGLGLAALGASKDARAMHGVLSGVKAEVADFQKSLKPETLVLFGDGAGIATHLLKDLQPVAASTGKALHGVLGQVDAEFASQSWQRFFGFMERTAGPDIRAVGGLFVDLTADLPPLLTALQPVALGLIKVTDAVVRLPSALDQVKAKTGANQPGFFGGTGLDRIREFVTWGEKHIPQGNKSISDLIGLTGRANSAATGAGGAVAAVGVKAAVAAPKIGTLAGDMAALNATVGSGNSVLAAYSDQWDKFVGKTVSDQQAVLNLKAAFESYNTTVKQSGRTSTAAQQAFLGIFTTLGTGLDALHKNGASVAEINGLYATTFSRLSALHGLTPQQRADVQGLTKDYLAWASTVQGLPPKLTATAGVLRDTFLAQLANGHRVVPTAKSDIDALANSVLKTGQNSAATAAARARLISDIAHSGLTAQAAQSLVKDFQRQIDSLKGKTVNVGVTASGSGGINVAATGLAARIFKLSHLAAGARIPGFGGGDVHPALLEGGETVVDKHTSRQLAPVFRAAGVPGYASGGVAGMPPFAASQAGADIGGWAGSSVSSMLNAMIAQYKATAPASGVFAGPGGGTAAQNVALAQRTLGWSGGEFADLVRLWTQESGWNQFAYNASSGATGIPQALPYTKMPRAAWLPSQGGSANVLAQETWGANYIRGRYGSPSNAWAHELAFNWYDRGGLLKPGLTLAYNGTGRPEQVIPPGRGGGAGTGPVTIVVENRGVIGSQAEADRWLSDAVDRLARAGKLAYALRHSPSAA